MTDSNKLQVYDIVRMHPDWIQNCLDFLGFDSVTEEDYVMEGMVYLVEEDGDASVYWSNGVYEKVTPCNLLKVSEDKATFDWRKVTEEYNKEKQ